MYAVFVCSLETFIQTETYLLTWKKKLSPFLQKGFFRSEGKC